jgi:hypothetical protein
MIHRCHPKFVVGPEVCGATRDLTFVDGHDVNARVRLEDVCLVDETCAHRLVRTPWTCKGGSAAGRWVCGLSADFKLEGPSDSPSRAPSEPGSASLSASRALDSELEALQGCT